MADTIRQLEAGRSLQHRMDALEQQVRKLACGQKAYAADGRRCRGMREWIIALERRIHELHTRVEKLED